MVDPKLLTLLTLCETQNYTRAAEQLSMTQPAVSQHIKQLERELGVRLFNRAEGRLKLTSEGEIAVRYATRIRRLYQNMAQEIRSEQREAQHLTVGITHTAESSPVAEVLAQCASRHEHMTISLVSDTINNLYEKLRNYELDLAVVEGRPADSSLNCLMLDTDCLVLAVSNDHPLAQKSMVTLEQLRREKMILRRPNSGTRNLFIAQLESQGRSIDEFDVILEVDNIATIKDLIRRNFGVSILARSSCLDELKKKKITVLPVENLSMMREINLVYPDDFRHPDLLQDILSAYRSTVKLYT